jgi:exodeoxyribonuclease VII small subunit
MTPDTQTPLAGFGHAPNDLETLATTHEKGELSLEASLEAFERGIGLARTCQKTLDQAEQRIRVLSSKSAEADLEPFAENV